NQVRTSVDRVLQTAGEDAHLDARKCDFEPAAVGLDLTALCVVAGRRASDLFGSARKAGLVGPRNPVPRRWRVSMSDPVSSAPRWSIPESAPLVPVEYLLRDLAAIGDFQRRIRLLVQATIAGHDSEFRREVARHSRPRAPFASDRDIMNRWCPASDRQ